MIEIVGAHLDIPDLTGALDEFVILGRGAQLVQRDREVGVLHLAG